MCHLYVIVENSSVDWSLVYRLLTKIDFSNKKTKHNIIKVIISYDPCNDFVLKLNNPNRDLRFIIYGRVHESVLTICLLSCTVRRNCQI